MKFKEPVTFKISPEGSWYRLNANMSLYCVQGKILVILEYNGFSLMADVWYVDGKLLKITKVHAYSIFEAQGKAEEILKGGNCEGKE